MASHQRADRHLQVGWGLLLAICHLLATMRHLLAGDQMALMELRRRGHPTPLEGLLHTGGGRLLAILADRLLDTLMDRLRATLADRLLAIQVGHLLATLVDRLLDILALHPQAILELVGRHPATLDLADRLPAAILQLQLQQQLQRQLQALQGLQDPRREAGAKAVVTARTATLATPYPQSVLHPSKQCRPRSYTWVMEEALGICNSVVEGVGGALASCF